MKVQKVAGWETTAPLIRRFFVVAEDFSTTDLFGDETRLPQTGKGRPAHAPSRLTRNRVLLGLVRGLTNRDIAATVGVSVSTLKEHYSAELKVRKAARLKMEMRQLERLNAQAEDGSVAAEKELSARLDRLRERDEHRKDAPAPKVAKAKPIGKKEAAEMAAREPSGLYDPPAAPQLH